MLAQRRPDEQVYVGPTSVSNIGPTESTTEKLHWPNVVMLSGLAFHQLTSLILILMLYPYVIIATFMINLVFITNLYYACNTSICFYSLFSSYLALPPEVNPLNNSQIVTVQRKDVDVNEYPPPRITTTLTVFRTHANGDPPLH